MKASIETKASAEKRGARRTGEAETRTEYLAFVLAGETYAVAIAHIAEILRPPPITEVPRASPTILGVVSVRGKVVTIVDLSRRLRLRDGPAATSQEGKARILLSANDGSEQVGLLVDEVKQVWRLANNEIEPASVLGGEQPPYIAGIGRPTAGEGETLVLLDLSPILEAP